MTVPAPRIRLPYNYTPRDYQLPTWKMRHGGCKRTIKVWHRRAGKDLDDWNFLVAEAAKNVGMYWHVFPYYKQARTSVWEGFTFEGRKYLDYVPKALISALSNQEMRLEMKNGSIIRMVGADNKDSLVGAGPRGVVLSEFPLIKPSVWEYIEPMLLANGGFAEFNGTPRGDNHFKQLVEHALREMREAAEQGRPPEWFVDIRTILDTGVITEAQIADLRRRGVAEEHIQQEYYCSFQGSMEGAYYAAQFRRIMAEGRICNLAHDEGLGVWTVWDLGLNDINAVWFVQVVPGGQVHLINYYESVGNSYKDDIEAVREIGRANHYSFAGHIWPHDGDHRQKGDAQARKASDIAADLGFMVDVLPRPHDRLIGIDQARALLGRCWFDEKNTKRGVDALKQYIKEYKEDEHGHKTWSMHPKHTWASNAADAFRYVAQRFGGQMNAPLGWNGPAELPQLGGIA